MRIVVDGQPIPAEAGDSLAVAMLRSGIHPGRGGTLCLAAERYSSISHQTESSSALRRWHSSITMRSKKPGE